MGPGEPAGDTFLSYMMMMLMLMLIANANAD